MALKVAHEFVSDKTDGGDPSLLQPSAWNADHEITVPGSSLIGRAQGSEGDAEAIAILDGSGLKLDPGTMTLELESKALATADVVVGTPVVPLGDMPEHRALTDTSEISWDKTVANQIKAVLVAFGIDLGKLEKQLQGGVIIFGVDGEAAFLPPTRVGEVLQSGTASSNAAWGGTGAPHAYLHCRRPSTTNDGNHPADTWNTRVINDQVYDFMALADLASNAFQLDAGTYVVEWGAPGYRIGKFQSRLFNLTDNVMLAPGNNAYSTDGDGGDMVFSNGIVKFDIVAGKNLVIQTKSVGTNANGCGVSSNSGNQELYTWVKVWKMAPTP